MARSRLASHSVLIRGAPQGVPPIRAQSETGDTARLLGYLGPYLHLFFASHSPGLEGEEITGRLGSVVGGRRNTR